MNNMPKIKLVCFDLDGTLIANNSWHDLNVALGVTPEEDQGLYDEYHQGKISYNEWIKKLLDFFLKNGKADLNTITKALSNYTLADGAREVVGYLKQNGYQIALISGSMDMQVDLVAKDLKIELTRAVNDFIFDGSGNLEDIATHGVDKIAKLDFLEDFCQKLGIKITECACVGDGANDIELFRKTKHGVTFKGSKIENEAWKVVQGLIDLKTIF